MVVILTIMAVVIPISICIVYNFLNQLHLYIFRFPYLIWGQVQLQEWAKAVERVVAEDLDGVVGEVEGAEVVAGLRQVGGARLEGGDLVVRQVQVRQRHLWVGFKDDN